MFKIKIPYPLTGAVLSLETGAGVLYAGTSHGRVRQFDIKSGVGMKSYTKHPTAVTSLAICGGNLITSDGRVRAFDASNGQCLASLILHNDAVASLIATSRLR